MLRKKQWKEILIGQKIDKKTAERIVEYFRVKNLVKLRKYASFFKDKFAFVMEHIPRLLFGADIFQFFQNYCGGRKNHFYTIYFKL